jgi:hypothetical protein
LSFLLKQKMLYLNFYDTFILFTILEINPELKYPRPGIGSSPFVYFLVRILFHKSNGVQSVLLFKILNDVAVCILLDLRYLI